ncbi:hypothetical protein LR48_Vigan10g193000 [Vigna angularis]|uniref:Uncharacterized protein n=1 Tax=Phaseolus angularis TaxID=3914 RepID=A0A0L9VM45_PHAAN|nr:hypothetical protein LR48_Vigan10g193000 [Vigna angularis]
MSHIAILVAEEYERRVKILKKNGGAGGEIDLLSSVSVMVDAKNLRFQLDEHRGSSSFPEAYFHIAFADHNDRTLCSKDLVDKALKRNIGDNLSAVVICFQQQPPRKLGDKALATSMADCFDGSFRWSKNVCPVCLTNPRDLAFGCGHMIRSDPLPIGITAESMSTPAISGGTGFFTGFTRLCKGLAVVLVCGHIAVQFFPSAVTYFALIPARVVWRRV